MITITGTVTDGTASATFSANADVPDAVTIVSATVTPELAPVGTQRTLTVVATSSAGLTLSATVDPATGITFTSVPNQPAGTFAWTFVF